MFSLIISESKVWTLFLAVPELVSLFRFLGQCPGLEIWILVSNTPPNLWKLNEYFKFAIHWESYIY